MNMNWDSLLEPIFLFILSLIAGTLWIIIPTDPHREAHRLTAQAVHPAPILRPVGPPEVQDSSPIQKAMEKAKEAGADKAEVLQAQEDKVASAEQNLRQLEAENQQLTLSISAAQKSLDKLRAELDSLHQQAAHPESATAISQGTKQLQSEIEALRRLLVQRQAESAVVETQLANTRTKSDLALPYVPRASPADKLPVVVELIRNRVVPVNKIGYKMSFGLTNVTATRKWEGETVAQLQAPGSVFLDTLNKIKADKQYLSCLLNADSFEAFRAVRQIAQRKGIDVGWEPADTAAGDLKLYRVRLQNKPSKGDVPRVAPILR